MGIVELIDTVFCRKEIRVGGDIEVAKECSADILILTTRPTRASHHNFCAPLNTSLLHP